MGPILIQAEYSMHLVGLRERVISEDRVAEGEVGQQLLEIAHQVVDGKLKPSSVRHSGTVDFDAGTIVEYSKKLDAKKNRHVTTGKPIKLELRHVTVVKLHSRSRDLSEFDENGKRVKPFVGISFEDGTSIEVPYTPPKKSSPSSASGGAAAR